jgi:hypothetical protein
MADGSSFIFDQRPGALEATRGALPSWPAVVGHRGPQGWRVAVLLCGEMAAELTPEQAEWLAADLVATARICRGEWGVMGSCPPAPAAGERGGA